MAEVENVALCKTEKSKIMVEAGVTQSPEKAHKLLIDTGIWDITKNPYPTRFGFSFDSAKEQLGKMPEEERCRLLGFHLEDAPLLLNQLLATYFDLDENDKAGIGKKIQMIMPYANLLASYHGTRRSGFNLEYMKNISQGIIKEKLLPSIREAIPLEW